MAMKFLLAVSVAILAPMAALAAADAAARPNIVLVFADDFCYAIRVATAARWCRLRRSPCRSHP